MFIVRILWDWIGEKRFGVSCVSPLSPIKQNLFADVRVIKKPLEQKEEISSVQLP